jgi:SAM-dependent methyltransferase
MRRNTPQLWDDLWEKALPLEADLFNLAREEHSIRWQRIEHAVKASLGSFEDRRVIELGAGSGTYAALMAKRGAHVTVLDYSEGAIQRGREFFLRNNLPAEFIKQDALALPSEMLGVFDISMSFGLVEHFLGTDRLRITQTHFDVLRPGGLTFISVPNKYCPPYRVFKFVAQRTGKWIFGEEYPASYGELLSLARRCGAARSSILGGSFLASFDFVNPFKALAVVRRFLRLKDNFDVGKLRRERGTFLDSRFAYALVLAATKP